MPIVVEAVYEGGVLRPNAPLPLSEHEKVRIIVESRAGSQATRSIIPSSDPGLIERIALDKDLEYQQ